MRLYIPTKSETEALLASPTQFRGLPVAAEAAPPAFLLTKAIAAEDGLWSMPRLFWDDVSGQIVGSGAFKTAPREGRVALGYGVAPAYRGRGHATSGVRLMIAEAFATGTVDEIRAESACSNGASRRVLEKAGFTHCGTGADQDGPLDLWSTRPPQSNLGQRC